MGEPVKVNKGCSFFWALMSLVFAIFVCSILLSACSVATEPVPTDAPTKTTTPTRIEATLTAVPTESPTPDYSPEMDLGEPINLLLLGGDYRWWREGTDVPGDKTDVMLLVRIYVYQDPIIIQTIQFPRNFYAPVQLHGEAVLEEDMWLFHVYRRTGFDGLHWYFRTVFDVPLHGIAYITMGGFESFIDAFGGVLLPTPQGDMPFGVFSGRETLDYLRDNENNWGCSYYDCEGRQFKVLKALAQMVKRHFFEDPLHTARMFWEEWSFLFETDLSAFEQFHYLVEIGWFVATSDYQLNFDRLTTSGTIVYGDTPLEVRGWIAPDPEALKEWFK